MFFKDAAPKRLPKLQSIDGPIPRHILALLSELSGLKEKTTHEVGKRQWGGGRWERNWSRANAGVRLDQNTCLCAKFSKNKNTQKIKPRAVEVSQGQSAASSI